MADDRIRLSGTVRPTKAQRDAPGIAMMRPIEIGLTDGDVTTLHIFGHDDGNVGMGLGTKAGTSTVLLPRRLACDLRDALLWLLDPGRPPGWEDALDPHRRNCTDVHK